MSQNNVVDINFSVIGNSGQEKHKILSIVDAIPEADLSKEKIIAVLKEANFVVSVLINTVEEIGFLQYHIVQEAGKCESCGKKSVFWSKFCGAKICGQCNHHQGLGMCFCGWNVRDDVDRAEVGMDEDGKFDGETWEVNY